MAFEPGASCFPLQGDESFTPDECKLEHKAPSTHRLELGYLDRRGRLPTFLMIPRSGVSEILFWAGGDEKSSSIPHLKGRTSTPSVSGQEYWDFISFVLVFSSSDGSVLEELS